MSTRQQAQPNSPDTHQTAVIDADAVAGLLGMGRDWVYAEARADRIPHVRIGRKVRFRRESIEAWLAEIERGPVATSGKEPNAIADGRRR